jgi:hypothetical protein
MCFACWVTKATETHSEYVILPFHGNNGYANAPQCYVIPILHVLFHLTVDQVSWLQLVCSTSAMWKQLFAEVPYTMVKNGLHLRRPSIWQTPLKGKFSEKHSGLLRPKAVWGIRYNEEIRHFQHIMSEDTMKGWPCGTMEDSRLPPPPRQK